jgi:hypothetical protein
MPVVVNEFEVIAEPSPPPTPAAPAAINATVAVPPDIERLLARQKARDERVRAY